MISNELTFSLCTLSAAHRRRRAESGVPSDDHRCLPVPALPAGHGQSPDDGGRRADRLAAPGQTGDPRRSQCSYAADVLVLICDGYAEYDAVVGLGWESVSF